MSISNNSIKKEKKKKRHQNLKKDKHDIIIMAPTYKEWTLLWLILILKKLGVNAGDNLGK